MISVLFKKPKSPFTIIDNRVDGSAVASVTTVMEPKEFIPAGEFEGSTSPFTFWKASAAVQNSTNTSESDYSQANSGNASCLLTIVSGHADEAFVVDLAPYSNQFADFNNKVVTITFYAKNATASDFDSFFEVNGGSTFSGVNVSITTATVWTKYTISGTFVKGGSATFFVVGVKKVATAGTVYLDSFSCTVAGETTEVPLYSYLTMSPTLTYAPADSLVGKRLIFVTGLNKNFGGIISDVTHISDAISRIDLTDALPAQSTGSFQILIPQTKRLVSDLTSVVVSVQDDMIAELETTSSVQDGFTTARITLNRESYSLKLSTSNVIGWNVLVMGLAGLVWEGYVASYTMDNDSVEYECVGYKTLLEGTRYQGYFNSDSTNTQPKIIQDMLSAQPEIKYTSYTIDRGGVLDALQVAAGGVGPQDYTTSVTDVAATLDEVLKMGYYGDESMAELFVQVWEGGLAVAQKVDGYKYPFNPQWIISAGSAAHGKEAEVKIGIDRADFGNVYYGVFSGASGEQLETSGAYLLRDVLERGYIEKQVTSGSLGDGEIQLVLNMKIADDRLGMGISDITVTGDIPHPRMPHPAYMMRAGDTVFVSDSVKFEPALGMTSAFEQLFVIGEVTCNVIENTARITPYKRADKIETMVNRLTIDTGGI